MEGAVLDPARKTSKKCQIEGCHDITVGSRTALCRKHRNNKYKQNYNKKKKRKAHGTEEMPSESIESQLAEEKCLMEQKYASMLQQVLAQKQLELLQSEKVIQVLRAHQQKVKQDKIREIQERKIKKEQEPKETAAQESAVSKIPSEAPSIATAKDSTTEKPHPKTTKSSKKSNQSKKSPGKAVMPKDVRIGNNLNFSRSMPAISKPPSSSSDLETKTLYTGVSISPSLGTNIASYVGQNPQGLNTVQQVVPGQPMAMTIQRIPKIDSIFSYQPYALGGVGNSSGFTKICIDSVKDLSLGPSGSVATSAPGAISKQMPSSDTNSFIMLNPKTMQSVHTRLPQNPPPYQVIQKGSLSGVNVTSQGNHGQSFQSLTTPCTSVAVTSGGNLGTAIGMVQQSQMTFPQVLNFSQGLSLSNSQITTSGIYTQVPQTSQGGIMSQNWSNQIMTGRAQTPAIQDDFLFQMLQENKDPQVQLGSQSQTNNALTSLDHVMSDQSWTMSIGM